MSKKKITGSFNNNNNIDFIYIFWKAFVARS